MLASQFNGIFQAHADAEDYTESDDEGADGYRTLGRQRPPPWRGRKELAKVET